MKTFVDKVLCGAMPLNGIASQNTNNATTRFSQPIYSRTIMGE